MASSAQAYLSYDAFISLMKPYYLLRKQHVDIKELARNVLELVEDPDVFSRLEDVEALFRRVGPTAVDFARLYEAVVEDLVEAAPKDPRVILCLEAMNVVLRRMHRSLEPIGGCGEILVATPPAASRFLEATIAGEILRDKGHSVAVLYPQTVNEISERLIYCQTDILVLAGSCLTPAREAGTMVRTVRILRAHPELRHLRIIVGDADTSSCPELVDALHDSMTDLGGRVDRFERHTVVAPHMKAPEVKRRPITTSFMMSHVVPRVASQIRQKEWVARKITDVPRGEGIRAPSGVPATRSTRTSSPMHLPTTDASLLEQPPGREAHDRAPDLAASGW